MKALKLSVLAIIALGLVFSVALAENGGSAINGKALFDNPDAFGGTKACGECHPDGKGLEKAGSKANLEEFINGCIVKAVNGEALREDSQHMKDMVAYIKSLGEAEVPGYGTSGYGSPGYGAPSYGGTSGYK